jgi:hypothetical protein
MLVLTACGKLADWDFANVLEEIVVEKWQAHLDTVRHVCAVSGKYVSGKYGFEP